MKRVARLLSFLPIIVLIGLGFYLIRVSKPRPPRITTGPFKMVVADVSVRSRHAGKIDPHDTDVTVAIDYQGPTPKWWGKPPSPEIPDAKIGGTHLVDEHGKIYRDVTPPNNSGLYNLSQTFDDRHQQYLWMYSIQTAFVPSSVHHLTFKTKIIHPTGTLPISVPVRDVN